MTAFKNFRDKKANQHKLPNSLKGLVCRTSGRDPKSYCCHNGHGVRCSSDFQRETDTCPGAGCPTREVGWCDKNYEARKESWSRGTRIVDKKRLKDGARCNVRTSSRYRNVLGYEVIGPCVNNGDIQESLCAQPCGCILDGQPKRESRSVMRTKKIPGECGSVAVSKKMLNELKSWGVPSSAHMNFEMGILGDSSHFTVFDLFIQPKKNEARYSLAIGASRCHNNAIEIGYMYTGMWKVDTVNNYKCYHKGGCSGIGISSENIENARKVLEWYAWKDLKVDNRRLLAESDASEETLRLRRRLPEDEEDFDDGDYEEEEFDEEDYEEEA